MTHFLDSLAKGEISPLRHPKTGSQMVISPPSANRWGNGWWLRDCTCLVDHPGAGAPPLLGRGIHVATLALARHPSSGGESTKPPRRFALPPTGGGNIVVFMRGITGFGAILVLLLVAGCGAPAAPATTSVPATSAPAPATSAATTTPSATFDQLMQQSIAVMQKRLNSVGVAGAQVAQTGDSQIEVTASMDSSDLVSLIGQTGRFEIRDVYEAMLIMSGDGQNGTSTGAGPRPTTPGSNPNTSFNDLLSWAPSSQDLADFDAWGCDMMVQGGKFPDGTPADLPDGTPVYPGNTAIVDVWDQPLFVCAGSDENRIKYLLGPALIQSADVIGAAASVPNGQVAYQVEVAFGQTGTSNLKDLTTKLYSQSSPMNQLALTLDGTVLAAPMVGDAITTGRVQITGTLTADQAQNLAAIVGSGALPLAFEVSSVDSWTGQQTAVTLTADQS